MIKRVICFFVLMISLGLTACTTSTTPTTTPDTSKVGFALPSEISAVPTKTSPTSKPGSLSKMMAFQAPTDAGTDYDKAVTVKQVTGDELEDTQIIGEILSLLVQTHYADEENINKGPYKAVIAVEDRERGVVTKHTETWVVDSKMVSEDGKEVNEIQVWIEKIEGIIKAEFKIFKAANQKSDGSYADYGVWTVNAMFGDNITNSFSADVSVDKTSASLIKIHEQSGDYDFKAILSRTDAQGFGKISLRDYPTCPILPDPCILPTSIITTVYAYNPNHLGVKKGEDETVFKSRTNVTEVTDDYGLFDALTGEDVLRTKSFGFPVEYIATNTAKRAYYGGWQGRHELWGDGDSIPEGTVVTREAHGNQPAETYSVSPEFLGILTKRTLLDVDINDIKGISVTNYSNRNITLLQVGEKLMDCQNMTFSSEPICGEGSSEFTDFASLVVNPNDFMKYVFITTGFDPGSTMPLEPAMYTYLTQGDDGPGFYVTPDDPNNSSVPATKLILSPGTMLLVSISGPTYIEYTGEEGTGWIEKGLSSYDMKAWRPVFDATKNKPYTLELDQEYYINAHGVKFIVKRTSTGTVVTTEKEEVANPINAAVLIPNGTELKAKLDDADGSSTFEFNTVASSTSFLKLVYKTVGSMDEGATVGDIVKKQIWGGLVGVVNGSSTQFNWVYPEGDWGWGKQQFLLKDGIYKVLDSPIQLTLTLGSKNLSLEYDGQMRGLLDLSNELAGGDFIPDEGQIINIPAGTVATVDRGVDKGKTYLVKPLMISQFLNTVVDTPALSLQVANDIDMSTVPTFVNPGMGEIPQNTILKYIEGIKVQ